MRKRPDEPAPERAFSPFAAGLAACYAVYPLAALYVMLRLPGRELAGFPLLAESLLAVILAAGLFIRKPAWENRLSLGVWFFLLLLFAEPWLMKLIYAWRPPSEAKNAAPADYAFLAAVRESVYFAVTVVVCLFLNNEHTIRQNAIRTPEGVPEDYFQRLLRQPASFRSLWLCNLPFGLIHVVCTYRALYLWDIIRFRAGYSLASVDTSLWLQFGGLLLFWAALFLIHMLRRHSWLPMAAAACAGLAGLVLLDILNSRLLPAEDFYYLRRSFSPLAEGTLIAGTAYMLSPGAGTVCHK